MTSFSEQKTSSMVAFNGLLAVASTNSDNRVIHSSIVFALNSFGISIDPRRTSLSFASISYKTSSSLMSFRLKYSGDHILSRVFAIHCESSTNNFLLLFHVFCSFLRKSPVCTKCFHKLLVVVNVLEDAATRSDEKCLVVASVETESSVAAALTSSCIVILINQLINELIVSMII